MSPLERACLYSYRLGLAVGAMEMAVVALEAADSERAVRLLKAALNREVDHRAIDQQITITNKAEIGGVE